VSPRYADHERGSGTSREKNATAIFVGVVIGALLIGALLSLAGLSTSTETQALPAVTLGDPQDVEPTTAVITEKRQNGGFSIAGLRFGHTTYRIRVQFYAAPGCYELVDFRVPWPAPHQDCASDVPITGTISGLGIAATGESVIGVDVDVGEDCYKAVARGDTWPPATRTCSVEITP
jgi:hypothetical protein